MPRLSIDITEDEHRRLKASAALEGRSIKEYVLERALGDAREQEGLTELAGLLRPRIEAADRGDVSSCSVADIARRARAKRKA